MSDREFPSGPWTGFYTYRFHPSKHRTDMVLSFAHGRMTGEGQDGVGPFIITGRYDSISKECSWTKTYVAAHDVFYTGFREGNGIWGNWEITGARGGFHIWPLDSESEAEAKKLEEEQPLVITTAPQKEKLPR